MNHTIQTEFTRAELTNLRNCVFAQIINPLTNSEDQKVLRELDRKLELEINKTNEYPLG